jgi:biotin carboxyl carrier protein
MKMEMWLHAAAAGVVRAVHVAPRETVAAGTLLVEIDLDAQ